MFQDFFQGKRVLVTGVAGVKGTWLALMLLEAGAEVIGIDKRLPSTPDESNFQASRLYDSVAFTHGDITDLPLMKRLVEEVDCVFHLAAVVLVGEAMSDPLETYRSNTYGTAVVLEALRQASKPKKAVIITTDKVYQPKSGNLWDESDPLGASGPYPVSKSTAEAVIADYQRQFFRQPSTVKIGVGRAGNVVIGGDFYSSSRTSGGGHLVVDCCEALAQGRQPEIFNPIFTRPYTYGLDILSGYMTLMSKLDDPGIAGEAFNFGPLEQYGIANAVLATKICELWGGDNSWRSGQPREEPFEAQSLNLAKAARVLRWRPAFTLYETLAATVRWYQEFNRLPQPRAAGCMFDLNRQLIREHIASAARLGLDWART